MVNFIAVKADILMRFFATDVGSQRNALSIVELCLTFL